MFFYFVEWMYSRICFDPSVVTWVAGMSMYDKATDFPKSSMKIAPTAPLVFRSSAFADEEVSYSDWLQRTIFPLIFFPSSESILQWLNCSCDNDQNKQYRKYFIFQMLQILLELLWLPCVCIIRAWIRPCWSTINERITCSFFQIGKIYSCTLKIKPFKFYKPWT